jgi:hypothetical protein
VSGPWKGLSVLVAALGGCVFVAAACTAKPAPETATESVQLQPVSDTGADPFSPPIGADVANVAAPARAGGTVSGNTVGLYGGTLSQSSCDPTKLTSFLQQHPDKATAWASVLGITAPDIARFVAELTPAVLRSDTYVINHGFANGQATTVPSVLQAGTAVLVDAYGFPVTRCFCGNPLTRPTAFSRVTYVGPGWSSFSTTSVTVVQSTTVVVNNFTLVEPHTGASFDRPRGTDGRQDGHARPGPVPSSTVDPHAGPGTPSPAPSGPSPSAATTSAADRSTASWAVGDCYGTKAGVHATVLVRNASRSTTHSYQATVAWGSGDAPYATQTAAVSGVAPGATGRTEVTADGSAPLGTIPCAITRLVDETGAVPEAGPDLAPPPDTQPQPTTDAPMTEPPITQAPITPAPTTGAPATPDEPTDEPTTPEPEPS